MKPSMTPPLTTPRKYFETCGGCRYFLPVNDMKPAWDKIGFCFRYPPTPLPAHGASDGCILSHSTEVHPGRHPCGEFNRRFRFEKEKS